MLFLFLALAYGSYDPFQNITKHPECDTLNRDDLILCFTHFDTNGDSELSASELQNILNLANFTFPDMTGANLHSICDIDNNGQLNLSDWNKLNSCCQSPMKIMWTCNICMKAGWTLTKK
jgi:hypothetical protein